MIELAVVFFALILLVIFTKRRIGTRVQNSPDEKPRAASKKSESNEKLKISCVSKSKEKKLLADLLFLLNCFCLVCFSYWSINSFTIMFKRLNR